MNLSKLDWKSILFISMPVFLLVILLLGSQYSGQFASTHESSDDYEEEIYGCTDSSEINYDWNATVEDGSCEYYEEQSGCTDTRACNYNPDALISDNDVCEYTGIIYYFFPNFANGLSYRLDSLPNEHTDYDPEFHGDDKDLERFPVNQPQDSSTISYKRVGTEQVLNFLGFTILNTCQDTDQPFDSVDGETSEDREDIEEATERREQDIKDRVNQAEQDFLDQLNN